MKDDRDEVAESALQLGIAVASRHEANTRFHAAASARVNILLSREFPQVRLMGDMNVHTSQPRSVLYCDV